MVMVEAGGGGGSGGGGLPGKGLSVVIRAVVELFHGRQAGYVLE